MAPETSDGAADIGRAPRMASLPRVLWLGVPRSATLGFSPLSVGWEAPDSGGGSGGYAFGGQTQGDQLILVCPGLSWF